MDNEHNIVAHGPTVPAGGGMLARRTVLRDMGTEYVVHTQVFHENGGTSKPAGTSWVIVP